MLERVYIPSEENIKNSPMYAFMRYIAVEHGITLNSYRDLHAWSVNNNKLFWEILLKYSGITLQKKYQNIVSSETMFGSKWFDEAELNFAENLLRYNNESEALVSYRENEEPLRITYRKLHQLVARVSTSLKQMGLKKGDRVAGVLSNVPEAVISMLAVTACGGVWSSCSPEFGEAGIMERFEQISPKFLIATERYSYNGKLFECDEKIKSIVSKIPSVEKLIWVEKFSSLDLPNDDELTIITDSKELKFNELLHQRSSNLAFTPVSFNDPVYIMYSSGTTGKPKCIVHGAGGTLLQHYKELILHTGLGEKEKILFYTTCGWMMWNWLVSGLMSGGTVYLFDGNPVYPDTSVLWDICSNEELTHLGISPKYLQLCQEKGFVIPAKQSLKSLRTILSTGAPLPSSSYEYIYNNIKKDIQISSISGGTDIISCFMLGNPLSPVFPGEIQGPGLGMSVEVWDENGKPVILGKGELVCTKSFPSMPVYFMNDEGSEKYKKSYFSDYEHTWKHGDFIQQTISGGYIVFGRSDTTLNPGGVRIGTAEIYKVVENFPGIVEAVAAGRNTGSDVEIVLFIVTEGENELSDSFINRLKIDIRTQLTPRHVPSKIFAVRDIPRTINGKKVEVAVTRIINNEEVKNKESIINAYCLEEYYRIAKTLNLG